MKEMMGCSRNHSKEIDIYSKSYSEKIQRIISMKDEGNQSFKDGHYDKASYYYAQALLIFYYLIPDTDEQERESETLKRVCHRNQAMCHLKSKRLRDAMTEIEQALKCKTGSATILDGKSLLRKAQILNAQGDFKNAETQIITLLP